MLSNLDDAIDFLRDFHASIMNEFPGIKVEDPSIPLALRKVYANFGDAKGKLRIVCAIDTLAGPADLRREGDFVHFLTECQGCWTCAYRVDDGPDPAVFLFGDEPVPRKRSDSLSDFLVTCLLDGSIFTPPFSVNQPDLSPHEAFNETVEPLWMEAVYSRPGPTHWFYWCKKNRILIMHFDGDYAPWLWMSSYEDRWKIALKDYPGDYEITRLRIRAMLLVELAFSSIPPDYPLRRTHCKSAHPA
jgi:hypothetical protein